MVSLKQTKFSYIDRGFQDTIVLIPGWASDYRIFNSLNLQYNYLLPIDFHPAEFEKTLLDILKENDIRTVSMLGWSLGSFVAAEFASRYTGLVSKLILVSIRARYSIDEIERIKKYISRSKKAYLNQFYMECFYNRENMTWFKKNLLDDYCKGFETTYLLDTLEYLKAARINTELLNGIKKIKIIHGKDDKIAPFEEAISVSEEFEKGEFLAVENAGHIPFLEKDLSVEI